MLRKFKAGTTSENQSVLIPDVTNANGLGLGGLAYNTTGLVCEYRRRGQSSWQTVPLVAGTVGAWTSGGFVADGTGGAVGMYQLGMPDAALASEAGVSWVMFRLYGAAGMPLVVFLIELDAVNYQDAAGFGLTRLDAAISTRSVYAGADTPGMATILGRIPGTVQPQTGDAYARLGAPAGVSIAADVATANASLAAFSNLMGTGRVTAVTNAGNFSVTFDAAYEGDQSALADGTLYLSFTSGLNVWKSSKVTGATLTDNTHAVLTFTSSFPRTVSVNDTFAVVTN